MRIWRSGCWVERYETNETNGTDETNAKDEFVLKKDLEEAVRLYVDMAKRLLG